MVGRITLCRNECFEDLSNYRSRAIVGVDQMNIVSNTVGHALVPRLFGEGLVLLLDTVGGDTITSFPLWDTRTSGFQDVLHSTCFTRPDGERRKECRRRSWYPIRSQRHGVWSSDGVVQPLKRENTPVLFRPALKPPTGLLQHPGHVQVKGVKRLVLPLPC